MSSFGNDDALFSIMAQMPLKTLMHFSMTEKRHAVLYEKQLDLIKVLDLSEFIFDKSDTIAKLKSFLVNKAFKNLQTIIPFHMSNKLLSDESFAEKFYTLHPRYAITSNGQQLSKKFLEQFPDLTLTSAELNQDFVPRLTKPDNAIKQLRVTNFSIAKKLKLDNLNFSNVRVLKVDEWLFCSSSAHWETFLGLVQKCPLLESLVVGSITIAADSSLTTMYHRFDRFCQQSHPFKIFVHWVQTQDNSSIMQVNMPHAAKFVQRLTDTTLWFHGISFLDKMTEINDFSTMHSVPLNWYQLSPNLLEIHAPLNLYLLQMLKSGRFPHLQRLAISFRQRCRTCLIPELGVVLAKTNRLPIRHLMLFTFHLKVAEDVRKSIVGILFSLCRLLETFYIDVELKPEEIFLVLESAPHLKSLRVYVTREDLTNSLFRSLLKKKIRQHSNLYTVNLISSNGLPCTVVGSDL